MALKHDSYLETVEKHLSSFYCCVALQQTPLKLCRAFEEQCIIFSGAQNCICGIRYHSYCWINLYSFFKHNIRTSTPSFYVHFGKWPVPAGLKIEILGSQRQEFWRNTHTIHVKDWLGVAAFPTFLVRSGARSFLHKSLRALLFCMQKPVPQLKRLNGSVSSVFSTEERLNSSFAFCSLLYSSLWRKGSFSRFVVTASTVEKATCALSVNGSKVSSSERELRPEIWLRIEKLGNFRHFWRLTNVPMLRAGS